MARYVVVEFPDNGDAESFIQQTMERCGRRRKEGNPFESRIVGVFVKPGKTCECGDSGIGRPSTGMANYRDPDKLKHKGVGVARGEKFGWWVCTRCNRPRAAGHQLVNQLNMSDTYEGAIFNDFEFCIDGLGVTGIHTSQVKRHKKLRPKKKGK